MSDSATAFGRNPNRLLTSIINSLNILNSHDAEGENPSQAYDGDVQHNSSVIAASPRGHLDMIGRLSGPERERVKSVLVTLHFLFPHELLPALDLLDRKAVTCLCVQDETGLSTASGADATQHEHQQQQRQQQQQQQQQRVYYVQSASVFASTSTEAGTGGMSARTGRHRHATPFSGGFYEVHLESWNCSCPAFAYSSCRSLGRSVDGVAEEEMGRHGEDPGNSMDQGDSWRFGGTATKVDAAVPLCKHILAVVLNTSAPNLFGEGARVRHVSKHEVAGWAAGSREG